MRQNGTRLRRCPQAWYSKCTLLPAKSDSDARRLFYEFDALARFQAAQTPSAGRSISPRRFIRYQALGRAILDAYGREKVGHLATPSYQPPEKPIQSIVIIDEIDKAPRDFTNDLLNEIDRLWFRVDELALDFISHLGEKETIQNYTSIETPHQPILNQFRPITIITSNIERQLPDAFLRRCVFHHIEVSRSTRETIVKQKLIELGRTSPDLDFLFHVVEWACHNLDRSPGLAETIDFATSLPPSRCTIKMKSGGKITTLHRIYCKVGARCTKSFFLYSR